MALNRSEGSSIYDVPAADAVLSPVNLVKVFGLANYKCIPQLVADHAAKSLRQTHLSERPLQKRFSGLKAIGRKSTYPLGVQEFFL